jgi:GMC oxidoreductase
LVSVPQTGAANCCIHFAQGNTLGGSSAINTMGYHRDTVGTNQRWADLAGNKSYNWENVLPSRNPLHCHLPIFKIATYRTPQFSGTQLHLTTLSKDPSKSASALGLILEELGLLSACNRLVFLLALSVLIAVFLLPFGAWVTSESRQKTLRGLLHKLAT